MPGYVDHLKYPSNSCSSVSSLKKRCQVLALTLAAPRYKNPRAFSRLTGDWLRMRQLMITRTFAPQIVFGGQSPVPELLDSESSYLLSIRSPL
jgi:hypothetical protein